jgi:purine-nucleoside phosphorylase
MHNMLEKATQTADYLRSKLSMLPDVLLILGSGLSSLVSNIENPIEIPYSDIPNFPEPAVESHVGKFVFGELFGVKTAVLCGRFHVYEGHSPQTSVLPVVAFGLLDIANCKSKKVIITNAAGGINPIFNPGDVMIISDQINLSGDNPLVGNHIPELGGEMFTDMSDCYTKSLRRKVKELANSTDIPVHEGVYAYRLGPVFETPAEIRMLSTLGADAVGMSTIHEVAMATHMGMTVFGLSCITNKAAGLTESINHNEVVEYGRAAHDKMTEVIKLAITN